MAGDPQDQEERLLRSRLRVLAERSGLPAPAMEVDHDPRGRQVPARVRRGDGGDELVTVSSSLLRADPVEQVWHLAAALGHWASPQARRRRRRSGLVTALVATLGVGSGLLGLSDVVDPPGPVAVALALLLPLALSLAEAATARHVQRTLDEAGWEVLRRAGYDPVSLTRLVFGDRRDPSWWARLHAREPTPSARVAAVERRDGPDVAPPLY